MVMDGMMRIDWGFWYGMLGWCVDRMGYQRGKQVVLVQLVPVDPDMQQQRHACRPS